jgi:ribosomal protein S15
LPYSGSRPSLSWIEGLIKEGDMGITSRTCQGGFILDKDSGSTEVQIAILTGQDKTFTSISGNIPTDLPYRRGLLTTRRKKRKMLQYISKNRKSI